MVDTIVAMNPRPKTLTITGGGGKIVIDLDTGRVTITDMTLDEAAEQFWQAVERSFNIRRPHNEHS